MPATRVDLGEFFLVEERVLGWIKPVYHAECQFHPED
jgi:hypothetical protein